MNEQDDKLTQIISEDPTAQIKPGEYDEKSDPEALVYYCKDCRAVVDVTPISRKKQFSYQCNVCKSKDVTYGTKHSITEFYSLDENGKAPELKRREKGQKVGQIAEKKAEKNNSKPPQK